MNKFVSVGKILNFHGIKGEAKVGYSHKDLLCSLKCVFALKDGEYVPLTIQSIKFNTRFAFIKFEGIDDINAVLEYKGCLIFSEEIVVKTNLDEDEYLSDELIGMDIVTDGKYKGVITGIANNGANDLLCVKSCSQKDCLVPFVKELVLNVDLIKREVTVKNIQGLIE